jgi:hypothetical protein
MATSKAKTIKLNDLAKVVETAVQASAGKKFPGGLIMGRIVSKEQAAKIDVNAVARDITRQVSASVSGVRLTPKVVIDGGFITMGFIMKPVELNGF